MTDLSATTAFVELAQIKARYCRALDLKQWDTLQALMTEDISFGMTDGAAEPSTVHGSAATIALLQSLVAGARTVHQVHLPEIQLAGAEADVSWPMQVRAVYDSGLSVTGYGRYDEHWVRQAQTWLISSLTLVQTITDVVQAD